jgi:hypothetical protein
MYFGSYTVSRQIPAGFGAQERDRISLRSLWLCARKGVDSTSWSVVCSVHTERSAVPRLIESAA